MKPSLPSGVSNANYRQDMAIFRTKFHRGALIGGIVFRDILLFFRENPTIRISLSLQCSE